MPSTRMVVILTNALSRRLCHTTVSDIEVFTVPSTMMVVILTNALGLRLCHTTVSDIEVFNKDGGYFN